MFTLAIALLYCGSPTSDAPLITTPPAAIATDTTDRSAPETAKDTVRLPAPLRANRKLNQGTDAPRNQRRAVLGGVLTRPRALRPHQYNHKLRAHQRRVHRLKQQRIHKHSLRNHRVL